MSDVTPSRWDDYLDVFVSPGRLFERRSDGKFAHAMLVFIIAAAVLYFATRTAMQPIMNAEFERGMAANPNLTPEQMEAGRKFAGIAGGIFVLVGTPILMLVLGLVIWSAARIVGKSLSYAQGATIATFAMFPRLVDAVVNAVQALLMDEASLTSRYKVSLGVGRFLDPENAMLLALVGRLDVFTLWITALIAIGIKVMTKASTGQAVAAAALVWLVGALPALLQAILS
jgi:Yip1-like protein